MAVRTAATIGGSGGLAAFRKPATFLLLGKEDDACKMALAAIALRSIRGGAAAVPHGEKGVTFIYEGMAKKGQESV